MNTKYLYSAAGEAEMVGLFGSKEAAESAAREDYRGCGTAVNVFVFDARPATQDDADLFDGAEDHYTGDVCDCSHPFWWIDRWVPENVVSKILVG